MENGERCNDCHGEGKEVDWGNPLTRVLLHRVIAWPSFREAAGGLDRAAIPVLAQLIDHRNRTTGQCNPSRDVLGGETAYSPRSVSRATAELLAADLIGKEQARYRGWAGTNDYWLTPRFFELAALSYSVGPACQDCSPPAAKIAAHRLPGWPTNGDLSDPVNANDKGKGERPPRHLRRGASHRRPMPPPAPSNPPTPFMGQKGGYGQSASDAVDPTAAAFVGWFAAERAAHYDDDDPSALRLGTENQARITGYLAGLVGEGAAWAAQRGIEVDRGILREDLARSMVRAWLAMPGTRDFLRERRHPIGLIVGDLERLGGPVLETWKRGQRPPSDPRPSAELAAPRVELDDDRPQDPAPKGAVVLAELAAEATKILATLGALPASRAPQPSAETSAEPEACEAPMQVRWVPAMPLPFVLPPSVAERPEESAPGQELSTTGRVQAPVAPPGEPATEEVSVSAGSPRGPTLAGDEAISLEAGAASGKGGDAPSRAPSPEPRPRIRSRHGLRRLAVPSEGAEEPGTSPAELDEPPDGGEPAEGTPRPRRYHTRTRVSLPNGGRRSVAPSVRWSSNGAPNTSEGSDPRTKGRGREPPA